MTAAERVRQAKEFLNQIKHGEPCCIGKAEREAAEIIRSLLAENAKMKEALEKAYLELKHAYVFVKTREKMASTGLDLYLKTMSSISEALNQVQAQDAQNTEVEGE